MERTATIFVVLSLVYLFRCGNCLNCYICNTQENPNCDNPKNHRMNTEECSSANLGKMKDTAEKLGLQKLVPLFELEIHRNDYKAPFSCMKAVSKVADDKEVILRGCELTATDNLNVCKKLKDEGKDDILHCNLCNESGCNSAPITTGSIFLLSMLFATFVALSK